MDPFTSNLKKALVVSKQFPCCFLFLDLLVRWLEKMTNIFPKWPYNGDESHRKIRQKTSPNKQIPKFFPMEKNAESILVGGFNPFEKY